MTGNKEGVLADATYQPCLTRRRSIEMREQSSGRHTSISAINPHTFAHRVVV